MILLDTNALLWLDQGHKRVRTLARHASALYLSPATLMELQFLHEAGRIRLKKSGLDAIAADDRWTLDDPPSVEWFTQALAFGWTRDPFDRLLAAHARLRRWRLATADQALVAALGRQQALEL